MDKEFKRRQIEADVVTVVGVLEIGRVFGKFFVPMPEVLANYSGDFAGGYCFNWFINTTMELSPLSRISENKRNLISAGITLGAVVAVETFHIFGTPQFQDVPAGVLGVIASYGVRKLAQRWVGEQVNDRNQ